MGFRSSTLSYNLEAAKQWQQEAAAKAAQALNDAQEKAKFENKDEKNNKDTEITEAGKPSDPVALTQVLNHPFAQGTELAGVTYTALNNGHGQVDISHESQANVSPDALLWFLSNLDGVSAFDPISGKTAEAGREMQLFRLLHPRDNSFLVGERLGKDKSR